MGNDGGVAHDADAGARRAAVARAHPAAAQHHHAARRRLIVAALSRPPAAGLALSAGRHLGRPRHQLRGLLGQCAPDRALPVRSGRPARGDAAHAAGMHRRGLARLSARARRPACLRLSRARPLRAAARPSLQSAQAAARSLCPPPDRARSARSDAMFGYRVNSPRADLSFDRRDSAPGVAKAVVVARRLQLGRRPAAQRAVVGHGHLRSACEGPDASCGPTCGRASAAPSPPSPTRRHRPSAAARHHRRRADADPRLRAGPPPAREGPAQLLGLQHARLLRPRAALPVRRHGRRHAHRRAPPARRRHRGHPRRRLQPHRRGQRARPDAVVPRPRQCQLLPAACPTIRATTSTTPAPATR